MIKVLSPKSTRVWQSSDGQSHSSEKEAKKHEVRIAMRKNILEFVPKGGDMRLSPSDLVDILLARPEPFIQLLQIARRK